MPNCEYCDRSYKNARTLSSHKYSFHRDMSSKPNAIAIVNSGIESRQNPRKRIHTDDSDEIRKRNKINETLLDSTSGESSNSDSTIDSEDEIVNTNKRIRVPDSSDEEPPAKIARKKRLIKRRKRKRAADQSNDEEPQRKIRKKKPTIHKHNRDPSGTEEYVYVSDTDEEEIEKIPKYKPPPRRKSRTPYYLNDLVRKDTEIRELKREIEALREEIRGFVGVKAGCESKISELQKLLEREQHLRNKEQEQHNLLAKQFEDHKENAIHEMTPLDKALNNSVAIDQINDIRHLIKSGRIDPILNDENKLIAIQQIVSGMLEGVIPISNPQNLAFTKKQKSFMKTLETIGLDEAKYYIEENIQEFLEIFEILDMSLKLVTKAFNKYGQKVYK